MVDGKPNMKNNQENWALVVEGGGMKGIYTAGILDAFHTADFNPFDLYIGVSAGTPNLSSFIAGQFQRNFKSYVGNMSDKKFISRQRFLKGGHWMDLDWLWEITQQENRIDIERAAQILEAENKRFLMVVTNVETGKPEYVPARLSDWIEFMKASCAIPFFYRNFCRIENEFYVDGGVSDPLPVEQTYREGARNIVVLRTHPVSHAKKNGLDVRLGAKLFKKNPGLQKAILRQAEIYNQAAAFIKNPPADLTILQIAPETELKTNTTTQSRDILTNDYNLGLRHGEQFLDEFKG